MKHLQILRSKAMSTNQPCLAICGAYVFTLMTRADYERKWGDVLDEYGAACGYSHILELTGTGCYMECDSTCENWSLVIGNRSWASCAGHDFKCSVQRLVDFAVMERQDISHATLSMLEQK